MSKPTNAPQQQQQKRKVRQIAVMGSQVAVLCDDGTMWLARQVFGNLGQEGWSWVEIPEPPQPDSGK